ncbi:UDP-N-acetylenolpyruvoylglucosamine reductase [Candidatus Roizmanbacteria bacterium RIFCSPHIGHO2_01_FULL_39_12b]|uniref:UDP-N-acetylenolpyruvoylglucosamine reductase n=1 Tax=Candidatus Roizmanbacteria bacterium RIFCSPHIGHO2_01_FULL_39_12b TaxID=1802030 RepID=A0A1F7GDR9_9BACT|nr:MAG: UDP-N-acetylenolpyruvoylglucosamine reductase [Candidatus Roizmanbacteria bacterium RIFCSPHIGHO2_01_FULL_39_12b]
MKHLSNISLKDHNTLKINASCSNFYVIENKNDLSEMIKINLGGSRHVLGAGANVLFKSDFKGTILQIVMNEISVLKESTKHVEVEADAGVVWNDLVEWSVNNNLGGIENMTSIPGLVGAAAVGNIAAYGQNISDVCVGLTAYEFETGRFKNFSSQECGFSYRESIFKNELNDKYLILSVIVRFNKNPEINSEYWSKKHGSVGDVLKDNGKPPYTLRNVVDAIIKIRRSKFPDMNEFGTAGSFFKNPLVSKGELESIRKLVPNVQYYPVEALHYVDNLLSVDSDFVKIAAGDILDNGMGYKGKWSGNVGLYKNHALVLVTNGEATGEEVDEFAKKVSEDFYKFCSVNLEREVVTI